MLIIIIIIFQVVFFGLLPLGILSTTLCSSMMGKKFNSFKLFITLSGIGLVYAIAYFLIGYIRREDFFQCNLGYGSFWKLWFNESMESMSKPYDFSSFDVSSTVQDFKNLDKHVTNKLTKEGWKADNPVLDPHMWATLGNLGTFFILYTSGLLTLF